MRSFGGPIYHYMVDFGRLLNDRGRRSRICPYFPVSRSWMFATRQSFGPFGSRLVKNKISAIIRENVNYALTISLRFAPIFWAYFWPSLMGISLRFWSFWAIWSILDVFELPTSANFLQNLTFSTRSEQIWEHLEEVFLF